jgi:hypothetical protein
LEFDEIDTLESDSLYEPQEIKDVARRLTFVLFEEIVESSPAQSRDVIFDPEKYPKDRELLDSVRKQGIVMPIVVRRIGDDPAPDGLFSGEETHGLIPSDCSPEGKGAGQNPITPGPRMVKTFVAGKKTAGYMFHQHFMQN